jgi:hypothetical protein
MAIISLTITESPIQYISGIPIEVLVEPNIASTVFYTFDGTDPTVDSDIAIGPIKLPTDGNSVTLKMYATNGDDASLVITNSYITNHVNTRIKQSKAIGLKAEALKDNNPPTFGYGYQSNNVRYEGDALIPVDDPAIDGYTAGYDGSGQVAAETDKPYNRLNYDILYSETDRVGRFGKGIGTLPATVTIQQWDPPNKSNSANSKLFNPKAIVIYQDGREPPADAGFPLINGPSFNSFNSEKLRDGMMLSQRYSDGNMSKGNFVSYQHNTANNTTTFYYFDSSINRWIISIEPTKQKLNIGAFTEFLQPISSMAEKRVYKWFLYRWSCHY